MAGRERTSSVSTKSTFKEKIANAGAWLKNHPGKAVIICLAAVAVLGAIIAAPTVLSAQKDSANKAASDANAKADQFEKDKNEAEDKLGQVTGENDALKDAIGQLKDNRSFEPSADQIKTIQSYQGQRIFTLKDMAEYNYNKADKELTIWFNAVDGNGQKALVSYSGSTNFKGDSFNTNDIMDWVKAKAKSQDENDQLDISVYQNLESYAKGSGAEALAKAVQAKVSADKGATTKVDVNFEGNTETMDVATTTPVWVCVERTSNTRGETVNISLAAGVGTGVEGKDIEAKHVSTLTGKVVSSADVVNALAQSVGASLNQDAELEV